jgi:hypothetical protein
MLTTAHQAISHAGDFVALSPDQAAQVEGGVIMELLLLWLLSGIVGSIAIHNQSSSGGGEDIIL